MHNNERDILFFIQWYKTKKIHRVIFENTLDIHTNIFGASCFVIYMIKNIRLKKIKVEDLHKLSVRYIAPNFAIISFTDAHILS